MKPSRPSNANDIANGYARGGFERSSEATAGRIEAGSATMKSQTGRAARMEAAAAQEARATVEAPSLSQNSSRRIVDAVREDMSNAPMDILLRTAAEIVEQEVATSNLLLQQGQGQGQAQVPTFVHSEISLGRVVGRGGFCTVRDVEKIKLVDGDHSSSSSGSAVPNAALVGRGCRWWPFYMTWKRKRGKGGRGNQTRENTMVNAQSASYDHVQEKEKDRAGANDGTNDEGYENQDKKFSSTDSYKAEASPPRAPQKIKIKANDESRFPRSLGRLDEEETSLAGDTDLRRRLFVARQSRRSSHHHHPFYVLKRVRTDGDSITTLKGMVDLAMEAKFLAALKHDAVLNLVGTVVHQEQPNAACSEKIVYGLLLPKLRETLSKRLVSWAVRDRQSKGITGRLLSKKNNRHRRHSLWEERLQVAHDIACGVHYLHSQRICFRDLKPDNIGFDSFGECKIFDFGLAKELKPRERRLREKSDDEDDEHALYQLTGFTGAVRYMAPEVGLGKPYNLTADVYSWSMLMWFILALEPPFGDYTSDMIVCRAFQRGSRPAILHGWPIGIADLLRRAWSSNLRARPTMEEIGVCMKKHMMSTVGDDQNELPSKT